MFACLPVYDEVEILRRWTQTEHMRLLLRDFAKLEGARLQVDPKLVRAVVVSYRRHWRQRAA